MDILDRAIHPLLIMVRSPVTVRTFAYTIYNAKKLKLFNVFKYPQPSPLSLV